jgi:uncharacterized membrane protein
MEKVLRNILFNCCFAINCLLLFFLLFENRMIVPAWLQVAGRMHPLLLHFPIVLLVVYVLWSLLIERKNNTNETIKHAGEWLLLLSAFTASATSLAGLFLSKEPGYDAEALLWHKWSGFAISLLTTCWYGFRNLISKWNGARITVGIAGVAVVVFTGHQGAAITHGENFLLAPVMEEIKQPPVLMEEAEVYSHMVKPIFDEKCMNCHNASKAKGELIMETEALLLKGGKNGKLWDSTAKGYGLLLSRLHLPIDDKKHMPPKGKPQLDEEETEILSLWIKGGAAFDTRVMDLADTDPLRVIANGFFNTIETDEYDFAAADEKKVKALNNNYRLVTPLAIASPALSVKFFSPQFYTAKQLSELLDVKTQIVTLTLDKMPVKDEELKTISQFNNLRKLGLSFTDISGHGLKELQKLEELRQVSLSGTAITKDNLLVLSSLKQLSHLYIWNTNLTDTDIDALRKSLKDVVVETGFKSDTGTMQLPPPMLVNNEPVVTMPFQVKVKHPVNGVTIRYTLDGTEPDSLHSPEYKAEVAINKSTQFRARAYKKGWLTSALLDNHFFTAKFQPDSAVNLQPADNMHKGNGAKTLIDLTKGDIDITGSDRWLGFLNNKMETVLSFNDSVTISGIILGTLVNTGGSIMPPAAIEIYAGNDKTKLSKLSRFVPQQPASHLPAALKPYEISFSPVSVKYIKIVAEPVSKLPAWHHAKGKKGWLFVDEVFVN